MVLVKMLMEIALPKMGEWLMMMITMISRSDREVPSAESLRRRAKVLLPKFLLKTAALRPESILSYFFLGQNDLYTRRGAPEVGRGGHNPPGCAWASQRAQVGYAHLVGPLWNFLRSVFFIYSIKNLCEVSARLELCIIGSLTQLFQVQNSSCRYSPSLCVPCIL